MDVKRSLKRNVELLMLSIINTVALLLQAGVSLTSEKKDFHLSYSWMTE